MQSLFLARVLFLAQSQGRTWILASQIAELEIPFKCSVKNSCICCTSIGGTPPSIAVN